MRFQLALFPGAPSDAAAASAPVLLGSPEVPELPPTQQMGLFDAQVRRLRDALEAIALADLSRARQLVHEREPWSRLGRALIARAAADVAGNDEILAGRLFLEAVDLERAKSVFLGISGPRNAATQFALGDVELALGDRPAARRHYRDALLLDPFDDAFDEVADVEVHGLASFAEFDVEIDSDPRAWCGAVGIVAGILPRPLDPAGELPLPERRAGDASAALCRARQFVHALVRAGSPDVQKDREALLEARRAMKRASAPLFAWYMARLGTR